MASDLVDECLKLSSQVQCTKVVIYNLIREVGRGDRSADNALHCLIEEYKNLGDISDKLGSLADVMEVVLGGKDVENKERT